MRRGDEGGKGDTESSDGIGGEVRGRGDRGGRHCTSSVGRVGEMGTVGVKKQMRSKINREGEKKAQRGGRESTGKEIRRRME